MTPKTSNMILILTLIGVAFGAALGYYFPESMLFFSVIGRIFVNALQLVVIPLIAASIIVTITSLGDARRLGRPLVTSLVYFVGTAVVAVCIGLIVAAVINPGWGIGNLGMTVPDEVATAKGRGIADIFLSLIPTSLPRAVIEGQYLGMIVISLLFGGVLASIGSRGRIIADIVQSVREVLFKLVHVILYVTPIGLFSVVGSIVARNSDSLGELSGSLLYFSLAVGAGLLIHAVIVLPLILKYIGRRSPLSYLSNMIPALTTAFGTGSSAVALPLTYNGVIEKNKVDSQAGSLVLPLGMTMNLNGTVIYVAISVLFIAQIFGINLSVVQMITMAVVCIFVSLGAASMPHASIFLLVFVLQAGRFPEEAYAGIGLILVVDWFFDRLRAVVNVWGDSVGAAVVSRLSEPKEARKGRPLRVGRQKAPLRERVTREPARSPRSSERRAPRPQRARHDTRSAPTARDQRDRTRRPLTPRRDSGDSREETRRRTYGKSTQQRPSHKPESAPVSASDSSRHETTESPSSLQSLPSATDARTTAGGPVAPPPSTVPQAGSEQSAAPVETTVEPTEVSSPEYGRLKSRRGRVVKDEPTSPSKDETETSNGQKEFPLENISFGRQKKKRQR